MENNSRLSGLTQAELKKLPDRSEVLVSFVNNTDDGVATYSAEFRFQLVNSGESITQGLSGRDEVPLDGMFFVMPSDQVPSFWMKEMKFDLDMIWLLNNEVVAITSFVPAPSPDTPLFQLPSYSPHMIANQVLEVPAGFTEAKGVEVGSLITITR